MNDLLLPIIILAICVGIAIGVRRLSRRSNELKLLCERGQDVVGTLAEARAERRSRTDKNHFIRYSFKSGGGVEHSRKLRVSESEFSEYVEGQDIDIVFLPSDPTTNATKKLVAQVREGLKKR